MAQFRSEIIQWGYTETPGGIAKELFDGEPTEKQAQRAQIVIVKFTNVDDPSHVKYATIRVPFGFGGLQPSALDDLRLYIAESAERYDFELVDDAP